MPCMPLLRSVASVFPRKQIRKQLSRKKNTLNRYLWLPLSLRYNTINVVFYKVLLLSILEFLLIKSVQDLEMVYSKSWVVKELSLRDCRWRILKKIAFNFFFHTVSFAVSTQTMQHNVTQLPLVIPQDIKGTYYNL